MKIKQFMLGSTDNLQKKIFFWNMISSVMNAFSSLVLSVVVARVTGAYTAGIFMFAYTIAQQMLGVGWYEMRPFQATDIKHVFSFQTYLASRIVTCVAMLVFSIPFIAVNSGSFYNSLVAFLMCIYKMFDAAEDVFHGMFQQQGRLDVAGRAMFFRMLFSTAVFLVTLSISHDLIITSLVAIAAALVSFLALNIGTAREFEEIRPDFSFEPLKRLLLTCFPLFAGSFLLLYTYSAPKYAIQKQLEQQYQTYYGALFMPTYIINLFSGFALKPLLTALAGNWVAKNIQRFESTIVKLLTYIMGFTVIVLLGAYVAGIPILSWIYGIDLSNYRMELIISLLGGGFSALSVVLYYALTVMRRQTRLIFVYLITFLLSLVFVPLFVQKNGITGATEIYLILMVIMSVLFILLLWYYLHKAKNDSTAKNSKEN